MDKYNINFPMSTIDQDMKRLINQLWKLIPMRENGEDWETHLKTMLEEISGLVHIYKDKVEGLILLSKLEGLTPLIFTPFHLPCQKLARIRGLNLRCL